MEVFQENAALSLFSISLSMSSILIYLFNTSHFSTREIHFLFPNNWQTIKRIPEEIMKSSTKTEH